MAVANTLAYYVTATIMAVKIFIVQALGLEIILVNIIFYCKIEQQIEM
jgi:hypothetical protein